jgi:hypothetical protein
MEYGFTILAPRRVRIGYGETNPARTRAVDLLWNDPEAAKREALKARAQYWLRRAANLERSIKRLEAEGRRDLCSYIDETRPLQADLITVRARLEELAVEAARCGVRLSDLQPAAGMTRKPRRRRRRVVSGQPRRRRSAAAAG